jgi:L-fuconolactonase
MDIVDAQVHLGREMTDATLATMNALRITSVLIDEFWGSYDKSGDPTHIDPGFALANGSWRAAYPTAEQASLLHPDRFGYIVRIDRNDPQLESVMRVVASSPNARAFRLQPAWTVEEAAVFAAGGYDDLLALAESLGLPVCLFIPGYVELLTPYVKKFPKLTFVIDHCGMGFGPITKGRLAAESQQASSPAYFDEVLKLAAFPNVAMKWSHAQALFDARVYPYESLRPILRRAIEAFGANRIMWASDKTVMFGFTWPDLLDYLRDNPDLSQREMEMILGGTARDIFKWPAPATPPVFTPILPSAANR